MGEEFQANPSIVHGIVDVVVSTKKCKVCKEEKNNVLFEHNRRVCKACKAIQSSKRNNNIEMYITDINTLKENTVKLKRFVAGIPKDKLIKVISHFGIGRKSSDTKAQMVDNTVEHFKCLQHPFLCRGGCGYKLSTQLSTCGDCTKVKARTKRSLQVFIDEVLPDVIANLNIIDNSNSYLYNKAEIVEIAKAIGITPKQKQKKDVVIAMINTHVEKGEMKIEELMVIHDEAVEFPLVINSIIIGTRISDGFVNATQMCKAGGKKFANWYSLVGTKELIRDVESDIAITASQFLDTNSSISQYNFKSVEVIKGNSSKFKQGSWIHPDLAMQLAQWISSTFARKVSKWMRELHLTGTVTLGQEKTNEQLIAIQIQLVKERAARKAIENKHRNILHRRSYHKFKKGNALYVISDPDSKSQKFKIGIDDVNINVRLAQHRTTLPALKLVFLIYVAKNKLIEEAMLERYVDSRRPFMNHEWIYDIDSSHIVNNIITLCDFLGLDYTVEENLETYNNYA